MITYFALFVGFLISSIEIILRLSVAFLVVFVVLVLLFLLLIIGVPIVLILSLFTPKKRGFYRKEVWNHARSLFIGGKNISLKITIGGGKNDSLGDK
mgnify:CR=1 FL=1